MSATPSKFVGFIGFILSVCLFSGEGIAEKTAETESHVVLEVGTRGILPCRIQRKAHLVQWKIELTTEHLLVYLNPYANVDSRGGSGYKEGLFNITEDYSLIIKDVKVQDEGLYICEVSDFQTGKVYRNKTRVFVRGTGASVTLEMGAEGILPCRIQRGAYEVKWKRQLSSDMSETELLVSFDQFFNVGERDGPGYKAGLFNITEDYSLVIKDVKVQDEGLYMCTLFDFKTGRVFRNSTRVFVQDFPEEPFPDIRECVGEDESPGVCTLTVHSISNLTCFVKGYYPDIDLFFQHQSHKVTTAEYEEWHNADGTKNKNIKIKVSVSDKPYECVASGLPGIGGNRSVSVIVRARPQARSQGPNVVKMVVPVFLVMGLCLSVAVICKCPIGNGRVPKGPVSKPELWKLVTIAKKENAFRELKEVLCRLGWLSKTEKSKLLKDDDFYKSLCYWKSKTSSKSNQRIKLYSVCRKVGMSGITRKLIDYARNTSYEVPKVDLEHILWETGHKRKITELLKALKLDHEADNTANEKKIRRMIYMAQKELLIWRHLPFELNPEVILSLVLDDLQCESHFFKIQMSLKEEIAEDEMKGMCCRVFEYHYKYLLRAIQDNSIENLPYQIWRCVEENNESLFNVLEMLHDWVRDEESSNYEKRNKLLKAVEAARLAPDRDTKWPPDDDLSVIASFLSPTSMEQLCSKLDIKSPSQEPSQEKRFQALTQWRDIHASAKDLMERHTELSNALKVVERESLVPRAKGPLVYKAELVDLAFHLFAQDLLPFTEALGISAAKLVDYRPTFQPWHMTQGTIGLVFKLFESRQRSDFFNLLKEMPNVMPSVMFALEVSFEEVCAISVSPGNRHKQKIKRNPVKMSQSFSPGDRRIEKITKKPSSLGSDKLKLSESDPLIYEDTTSNEYATEQSESKLHKETTNCLTPMLTSASKVEDPNQVSPESSTFIKHFKLWRKQPRMTPYNFRLAVANRLRIKIKPRLMSDFLRDDCNKGEIPLTFIYDDIQTMDSYQARILSKLIGLAPFSPVAVRLASIFLPKEELPRLEEISQGVHTWAKEWIQQIEQSEWKKGEDGFLTSEVAKERKEFNDKLVDHGFIDLAREIMISEQQLIHARQASGVAVKE